MDYRVKEKWQNSPVNTVCAYANVHRVLYAYISSWGTVYVVAFIQDKSLFICSLINGKSILFSFATTNTLGMITYQIFNHDRTATEGSKRNMNLEQM